MTPDLLPSFSTANPPNEVQFREIGRLIATKLEDRIGGHVEILDEHIETSAWVTNRVFVGDRETLSGICYCGIVSCSLRPTGLSITSVLLMFSDGNRVREGRKSILASKFTKSGWEDFVWTDDEYGEWDCGHISEVVWSRHINDAEAL